jgi:hypothetical protein
MDLKSNRRFIGVEVAKTNARTSCGMVVIVGEYERLRQIEAGSETMNLVLWTHDRISLEDVRSQPVRVYAALKAWRPPTKNKEN